LKDVEDSELRNKKYEKLAQIITWSTFLAKAKVGDHNKKKITATQDIRKTPRQGVCSK